MTTAIESAEPRSAKSSRVLENPPHARRTMEALRELGYDSYASILDIIDNCIDAHATIDQCRNWGAKRRHRHHDRR